MASITFESDKSGTRSNCIIQFVDPTNGKRRTVRPGKMTKKEGEAFKTKLERLLLTRQAGTVPESDVAEWLGKIELRIANQFAEWNLMSARVVASADSLGRFLDDYFAKRTDVKPSTQTVYKRVRRHLVRFFSVDKLLTDITAGDADDWRLYLKKEGLAENTVRRHIGCARQFFKVAVRHKLITENPFMDLKASIVPNASRFYFVTVEETRRLIAACNSAEWRLIIALARFGGLRTPSETFALEWQHVNWETNRITVQSPKTEHHEGHATRVIPIFPELRPYLNESWELAKVKAVHLVTSYRDAKQNLRTQFERIIHRAGLKPWPKLFQNLRSSRETELAELFPIQVVTSWLGNSEIVARKHYLQVTEDHFAKALRMPDSAALALQPPPASVRPELPSENPQMPDVITRQGLASLGDAVQFCTVGGTGLEQIALSTNEGNRLSNPPKIRAALALHEQEILSVGNSVAKLDPGFADLAAAWSRMSPEARAAVAAVIQQSK